MNTRSARPPAAGSTLASLVLAAVLAASSCHIKPRRDSDIANAKAVCSQVHLQMLADALQLFEITYGFYPPTRAGLGALMQPVFGDLPILPHDAHLVQDCWGHPIHYQCPSPRRGERFELWSEGPDGASGTADDLTIAPSSRTVALHNI